MIRLTEDASKQLARYLDRVRLSLQGCGSIDALEVERDVKDHIDRELQGATEPVGLVELTAVLKNLGSPSQWVPKEDLPWWRQIADKLKSDEADWRLAISCFVLFFLGLYIAKNPRWFFLFALSAVNRPAMVMVLASFCWPAMVMVLASFCLARVCLFTVQERQEELGAQKWLIYPPLIFVYSQLIVVLLLLPAGLAATAASVFKSHAYVHLIMLLAWAIEFTLLGMILKLRPKIIQVLFRPFIAKTCHRWGKPAIYLGITFLILFVALYFLREA